ncbi:hypothetical protein SCHPADRAFT_701248 [Schizopora paradoxa]|uniref:Uncharacterized protein n=1 Tax=Schizopora paradoxa TaxID=27342 RepID=A0A0H2RMM1_9AGAM|nr:hypothetical protein SCHPADRAFT_701248 [Schizopora paradoxa]
MLSSSMLSNSKLLLVFSPEPILPLSSPASSSSLPSIHQHRASRNSPKQPSAPQILVGERIVPSRIGAMQPCMLNNALQRQARRLSKSHRFTATRSARNSMAQSFSEDWNIGMDRKDRRKGGRKENVCGCRMGWYYPFFNIPPSSRSHHCPLSIFSVFMPDGRTTAHLIRVISTSPPSPTIHHPLSGLGLETQSAFLPFFHHLLYLLPACWTTQASRRAQSYRPAQIPSISHLPYLPSVLQAARSESRRTHPISAISLPFSTLVSSSHQSS